MARFVEDVFDVCKSGVSPYPGLCHSGPEDLVSRFRDLEASHGYAYDPPAKQLARNHSKTWYEPSMWRTA